MQHQEKIESRRKLVLKHARKQRGRDTTSEEGRRCACKMINSKALTKLGQSAHRRANFHTEKETKKPERWLRG